MSNLTPEQRRGLESFGARSFLAAFWRSSQNLQAIQDLLLDMVQWEGRIPLTKYSNDALLEFCREFCDATDEEADVTDLEILKLVFPEVNFTWRKE